MSTFRSCRKCGVGFYASHEWKKLCVGCFIESKNGQPSGSLELENARLRAKVDELVAAFPDQEMLRRIRMLCHPDKHGGSLASVTASQWINTIYGKESANG